MLLVCKTGRLQAARRRPSPPVVDAETLVFQLKTPWANGTTSLVLSPTELIEKLAALVPPPRLNLVRYHGVLASACHLERPRLHRPAWIANSNSMSPPAR